jgi:hypothetical protein
MILQTTPIQRLAGDVQIEPNNVLIIPKSNLVLGDVGVGKGHSRDESPPEEADARLPSQTPVPP